MAGSSNAETVPRATTDANAAGALHRRALRGITASCVLLTVIVVLLAIFADHPRIDPVLRPLHFALLFSFFHAIGRRQPDLVQLPFRLIKSGFAVLTLGSTTGAVIKALELSAPLATGLVNVLDRGGVFLLGISLISYGILLWLPTVLDSRRVLRERYVVTRGALQLSETARSRMEERFIEADRMHALGELAAGVAHDLRNPLAIVRAAANSLVNRPRSAEDLAEHTAVIVRNIDKAERTITALLDLGKPRAFALEDIELQPLLAEISALLTVESRRRGVDVVRVGEESSVVRADRKLLSQVLLNLVLNALQASQPGDTVQIVTRRMRISGTDNVVVAIEDRGHGIEPADRDKLFTPFFTTKPEGTGLGLLSCRRLMHEMSGRISLSPRHRGGTRALLALPTTAAEVVAV